MLVGLDRCLDCKNYFITSVVTIASQRGLSDFDRF